MPKTSIPPGLASTNPREYACRYARLRRVMYRLEHPRLTPGVKLGHKFKLRANSLNARGTKPPAPGLSPFESQLPPGMCSTQNPALAAKKAIR